MHPERLKPEYEQLQKPVAEFEGGKYQLFNIDELSEEERSAVRDAIAAYGKSDNKEFRAGAVAVAENGDKAVRHNEVGGPEGHAEMLAVGALYRSVAPGKFKLKAIALAGTYPDEELVRREPYGSDVKVEEIDVHTMCGRCRKFVNDHWRGHAIDEHGKDIPEEDVAILMVTGSNQVLRSTLRTLYPLAYMPSQVSLKSLEQSATHAPDTYGPNGNGNGKKDH